MTDNEVNLYVYDLSRGMARSLSPQLLGRQLDGIWHTSVVVFGYEYFFGSGVNKTLPGMSHHGTPQEVLSYGRTEIPREVFDEYLAELKVKFSTTSYHLLDRNCNNFTDDVINFLVDKHIPEYIRNLPENFANTALGQQLRPMIDRMFNPTSQYSYLPSQDTTATSHQVAAAPIAKPIYVLNMPQLESLLDNYPCAIVDFTSPACSPCVAFDPEYEFLASEFRSIRFLKVNVLETRDIPRCFSVTATPTFLIFHQKKVIDKITGANSTAIRASLRHLSTLAEKIHRHLSLNLKYVHDHTPHVFDKIQARSAIEKLEGFVIANQQPFLENEKAILSSLSSNMHGTPISSLSLPPGALDLMDNLMMSDRLKDEELFPAIDLMRILVLSDDILRNYISSADPTTSLIVRLWNRVMLTKKAVESKASVMMSLRLACNIVSQKHGVQWSLSEKILPVIVSLVVEGLLHSEPQVRNTTASLAYNLALILKHDAHQDYIVECVGALQDAFIKEKLIVESHDALFTMLLALGKFTYCNDEIVQMLVMLPFKASMEALIKQDTLPSRLSTVCHEVLDLISNNKS